MGELRGCRNDCRVGDVVRENDAPPGRRKRSEGKILEKKWRGQGGSVVRVGSIGADRGFNVGGINSEGEATSLGAIDLLGGSKPDPTKSGYSGVVCCSDKCNKAGHAGICKGSVRRIEEDGAPKRDGEAVGGRIASRRSGYSNQSGKADSERVADILGDASAGGLEAGILDCVEDGFKVGRSLHIEQRQFRSGESRRGDCRLVHSAEGNVQQPVSDFKMGGDFRRIDSRDRGSSRKKIKVRKVDDDFDCGARQVVEGANENGGVLGAFNKARGHFPSSGFDGKRSGDRRGCARSGDEARIGRRRISEHLGQVWWESGRHGEGAVDSFGNRIVMNNKHNICRRPKKSKLPSTNEEWESPLHVDDVPPLDLNKVRAMMSTARRKRFDDVVSLTFEPKLKKGRQTANSRKRMSSIRKDFAEKLVTCGVASPSDRSGPMENIPFTVVESKKTGLRQRFILWTKQANDELIRLGYKADVPLEHISRYLDSVRGEVASCRDFRTGFYQIEIPEKSRRYFRFQADGGEWYELTRLPMGHSCAPELMHSVAATLAGDVLYARPDLVVKDVRIDSWIDNIRYVGRYATVRERTRQLDERAESVNATWKPADSVDCGEQYDFLGVEFNHQQKKVQISSRLRQKLEQTELRSMTAGGLETLMGRLMHASAVSATSPGLFWFAIKYSRRIINRINGGSLAPEDGISIPSSIRKELQRWIHAAMQRRTMPAKAVKNKTLTVFVDASLDGWGGVIVDENTKALSIVGERWVRERGLHINVLEAAALRNTLRALNDRRLEGWHFRIRVDNTSVMGAVRKRQCVRNEILNRHIVEAIEWLARQKCSFDVRYIASKKNPADGPSRVSPIQMKSMKHRVGVIQSVVEYLRAESIS